VRKSEKKPIRKLDMMRGYARSIMLILALAISALWLSESHWFLSPIVVKSIKIGLRNVLGVMLFWFAITFLIGGSMRCYLCCHVALTNENYSLGDLWRAFSETCDEEDSDNASFEMIDTNEGPYFDEETPNNPGQGYHDASIEDAGIDEDGATV